MSPGMKGILRRSLRPEDASRGGSRDLEIRAPQKRTKGTSEIKETSKS